MDEHQVERMRRSIAMLPPGSRGLVREEAFQLLSRLAELERLVADLRERLHDLPP